MTHLWVLYRPSPYAGACPRVMLAKNLCRRGHLRPRQRHQDERRQASDA